MSDHSQVYAVKLEGQQMHNELYQTHAHTHTRTQKKNLEIITKKQTVLLNHYRWEEMVQ